MQTREKNTENWPRDFSLRCYGYIYGQGFQRGPSVEVTVQNTSLVYEMSYVTVSMTAKSKHVGCTKDVFM